MLDKIKEFFHKGFHPEIKPLRNRIFAYIVALPIVYFMIGARSSKLTALILTACFAFFLFISAVLEYKSIKKDKNLKKNVENGDYYSSDQWNEKYLSYINTKGFDQIKGSSMRVDLAGKFRKPSAYVMIFISVIFIFGCFITDLPDDAIVAFILGAAVFFCWGIFKMTSSPVRRFFKKYSAEANEINDSYMNGRMLTFKRNGTDKCIYNGINIGREYTVIFDKAKIIAVKNSDIELIHRYLKRTKYYDNSIYTGTKNTFHLNIILKNRPETAERPLNVELNEFQTQMALEEFRSLHIKTTYEGNVLFNEDSSVTTF